jgi:hypothetical protein
MPHDPGQVRAAANRLSAALDAHLRAVEERSGEQDPGVQQAYRALREAAAAYDDLLFDVYGEVTPFVLAKPPRHETFEVAPPGGDQVQRLSLLSRTDVVIEDPERLLQQARAEADGIYAADAVVDEASAVGVLVEIAGVDAIAAFAEEYGLRGLGSTVWLIEAAPKVDDTWRDHAFASADTAAVLYRLDASNE